MKRFIFVFLFTLFISLSYGQYYRARVDLRIGVPNLIGLTGEYLFARSASIAADITLLPFNEVDFKYVFLGLRKYWTGHSEGFYATAGAGYIKAKLSDRQSITEYKGMLLLFGGGYHLIYGNFSLIPEIGYAVGDKPSVYGSLGIGVAFDYY